jgi:hypothetical protein
MVATVLTLLYVPALYLINKDIIRLFSAKEGRADIGDQTTANG